MRKLFLILALTALLAGQAYAGMTTRTMIDDETLTGVSDRVEADWWIGDTDRVSFFVTYDQDGTTVGVTSTDTAAVSLDGINWKDIYWYDVAGGLSPQTSEQLTVDTTYVGWLDPILIAPYIRIAVKSSGAVGENADVTVTLVSDK